MYLAKIMYWKYREPESRPSQGARLAWSLREDPVKLSIDTPQQNHKFSPSRDLMSSNGKRPSIRGGVRQK